VVAGRAKAKKKIKILGYGTGSHGRSLSRSYRFIHIIIAAACPWPIVFDGLSAESAPCTQNVVHKTWFCIHGAFSRRKRFVYM
jgi:hypothetical protein